ncbi:MAG: type II toxin-antitoxin system RelE/ParE family toxin [Pseudomonadota bacterium]
MIVSFADRDTENFFASGKTKAGWQSVAKIAARKLDALQAATRLDDLRAPPSNRLELLRGDRAGQYSIRINDQWRLCFRWTDRGPADVEIADYH